MPRAKARREIAEVACRRFRRALRIFALIDPVIDAQAVDARPFWHELPQPDRALVAIDRAGRSRSRSSRQKQEARQAVLVQRLLDQLAIASLLAQPRS